ncbi:MAG: BlaI/MecI/CopY family transcriptional regulator [Fimbriimonadaceae bacterium]|nr:BlaI/MecI/CopY family transcriptional regulator [Fimbriimonadaceae bacterium]
MPEIPPLSDAQLEIMGLLWDRGEGTLGELWSDLNSHRTVARNTVQTLLTRMVEKGWVTTRPESRGFVYLPARPRAAGMRTVLRRLIDTAFRGSAEGLVLSLLDGDTLDEAELARVRNLLSDRRSEP